MASPKFEIPAEYQDKLRFVPAKDVRADGEILQELSQFRPVRSEKNVWAFWHQGVQSMPTWCKRNVCSWVRIQGPEWTVRVLDNNQESENYALKYLDPDLLPDCFVGQTMDGPYVGPHSADMLRGACLFQHGGVFMDVGNILIRNLERICWSTLDDPDSPYEVATPLMYGTIVANHITAARKNNPFIQCWHKLFCHLWQGRTNSQGLLYNPLMIYPASSSFQKLEANKFDFAFNVPTSVAAEYGTQVMCWQRLTMLEDAGDGFDCRKYLENHILMWSVLDEDWAAEEILGFRDGGEKIYHLLSLPVKGDDASEDYQTGKKVFWHLLSEASLQKVFHGKSLLHTASLGQLLDKDETERDTKEGTFGELLRYGSENFEQTRSDIRTAVAIAHPQKIQKGLLEP